jgi:hypothetical protein
MPLLTRSSVPKEYGVDALRRTVVSATAFYAGSLAQHGWYTLENLGRFCTNCDVVTGVFYAPLDLPAGVVIDYIGVNSTSDTDGVLGVALWERDRFANKTLLHGFSLPAHGWDTDISGPLNILVEDHVDKELVLQIEQAIHPNFQYFGWVEVWWRRTVSPGPSTATFTDVPPSHPFFPYVEALVTSGVTAGCGGGRFCVDDPLTRGQMAVFLSKALGLHWPN